MSNNEMYSMIGKRLAGESSELEDRLLDNWLESSPENREMYRVQEEIWKVDSHYQKKEKEERLFTKVLDGIGDRTFSQGQTRSKSLSRSFLKYAAAASLILIGVWFSMMQVNQGTDTVTAGATSIIEKINPKGQKSKIHLPDGSVVILNAASSLRYPSEFNSDLRQLELEGEAYFEVAKDEFRPFIVKSGNLSTTALGTEFNVRAYPTEDMLEIALTEGKVRVENLESEGMEFYLVPGESVEFNKSTLDLNKSTFSIEQATAWKDGIIHFENASMDEVIQKLELWYDVNFEIDGKAKLPWNYSGQFQNEYLNRVLESISYTQDFKFEIKDKQVRIEY